MTGSHTDEQRKPRALFINTRSALGADVAVHLSLIQSFDPQQVDVSIATNRNASDLSKTLRELQKASQTRILVCDLGYELSGRGGKVGKLLSALKNVGALFTLLRLAWLVRRERIGILHTTDRPRDAGFTTLLARLTGAKCILHLHIKWDPQIGRAAHWAVREAAGVIAISQFTRQSLIEGGIPEEKIFTTHNATDPETFDPAKTSRNSLRSALGLSPETPLIGIVARIMVWKGQRELVEAFAEVIKSVPEAHLAIVGAEDLLASGGDGYAGQVRQRIEELGLSERVHWTGWQEDVPAVMADLDILAVPSWEEPFGLVVTEGMAMERPIVGYHSGALPEILTDGQEGLLVPPKNREALAGALIALLQDPERRRQMGRRGRERVLQQFTPRRQAAEVEWFYRQVVAGKPFSGAIPPQILLEEVLSVEEVNAAEKAGVAGSTKGPL